MTAITRKTWDETRQLLNSTQTSSNRSNILEETKTRLLEDALRLKQKKELLKLQEKLAEKQMLTLRDTIEQRVITITNTFKQV